MNIKETQLKSVNELTHEVREAEKKLDQLKFQAKQNQLKNVREIRLLKKDVARLKMILQAKNKA